MSNQQKSDIKNTQNCEKEEDEGIRNVWNNNCEEEMTNVSKLISNGYTVIAMDTEYPGFIHSLHSQQYPHKDLWYEVMRNNVNDMNLIQIGITLSDPSGKKPEGTHTWQFNLEFFLENEKSSPDSICILKEAGIDFSELQVNP
jgi:CCR4-NOT transcription complex subunit 7/8